MMYFSNDSEQGILNKINQIFTDEGINIAAQFLQTNPQIGYVVIDVETNNTDNVLQRLRSIEGTIKARVLF